MLSASVTKNKDLDYKINLKPNYYSPFNFNFKWKVENTGSEAREADNLSFDNGIDDEDENDYKTGKKAHQSTKFNGLHYMICLKGEKEIARYAIIINDEKDLERTRILFNE